jgi:hypothetical protein
MRLGNSYLAATLREHSNYHLESGLFPLTKSRYNLNLQIFTQVQRLYVAGLLTAEPAYVIVANIFRL